MIIDTRSIKDGHSSLKQNSTLESVRADLPSFDTVACKVDLDRTGPTIYVHVWFSGDFKLDCSRCLITFDKKINGEIRLILKEKGSETGQSIEQEDADFLFDSQSPEVDISSAIYDEIMTEIPIKPLCKEACKGVALKDPNIKIDYDGSDTKVSEKPIDPRWDALKKLRHKNN